MPQSVFFQDSLMVSGIMCFDSCGNAIQNLLNQYVSKCIKTNILPEDATVTIDAEPCGLGIHRLIIAFKTSTDTNIYTADPKMQEKFSAGIKEEIQPFYEVIEKGAVEESIKQNNKTNWVNIFINVIAMGLVIALSLLFPPSLPLSIGLTALSFVSTVFTGRKYLLAFLHNLKTRKLTSLANMSTTVSLGWFSSMAHTLFHVIKMPMTHGFSMVFMNFIMPNLLITCINAMDELKRLIVEESKKIQLNSLKTLFPEISEKYACFSLSEEELNLLSANMVPNDLPIAGQPSDGIVGDSNKDNDRDNDRDRDNKEIIEKILKNHALQKENKNLLEAKMIIEVNTGESFPVDGILIQGSTVVDASIINGEPQRNKKLWQRIPAGAINLGEPVLVYAEKNPYNSKVNTLLFRSNRKNQAVKNPSMPVLPKKRLPSFAYFYTAFVVIGIIAAIIVPVALDIIMLSIVLQHVMGILFSVCPCTFAIAYQLPELLSLHYRSTKGIHLQRKELLDPHSTPAHTIIFDKTGTLTTGNSRVAYSLISVNDYLWERIYLLEKAYGRDHPIAKAILKHYEANIRLQSPFKEVKNCEIDPKNRGLSALVQEKKIHIGNPDYLQDMGISVPPLDKSKLDQGFSVVCVAENGIYCGAIYIQHELREGVVEALVKLKKGKKKIIMLTGDNIASAKGLNEQLLTLAKEKGLDKDIEAIFDDNDIHAGQTPEGKEAFLREVQTAPGVDPAGVWFIGDGLNDTLPCREASERGGMSWSVNATDKSTFFTDISLNGSFDYLLDKHELLNLFLKKILFQNKCILTYSTLTFLVFNLSFLIVGVALSPLIPMAIMVSTTLFVLFNSYRIQFSIDNALNKQPSRLCNLMSSDLSSGLLLVAGTLLIVSILSATLATGGLALPIITFTSALAAFCSVCTLSSISLFGVFSITLGCHLGFSRLSPRLSTISKTSPLPLSTEPVIPAIKQITSVTTNLSAKQKLFKSFCWSRAQNTDIKQKIANCGQEVCSP